MAFDTLRRLLARIQKSIQSKKRTQRSLFVPLRLEQLEERINPDTNGPLVLNIAPTEVRNAPFDTIDVRFNEAINSTTLANDDIPNYPARRQHLRPQQHRHARPRPLSPDIPHPNRTRQLSGPSQAHIDDLAGNLMNQNQNGIDEATYKFTGSTLVIQADATSPRPPRSAKPAPPTKTNSHLD